MNPPWGFLGSVLESVSGSLPLWAGISLLECAVRL